MTERSQHQIPPTAHTQRRIERKNGTKGSGGKKKSRPTSQQCANHNNTTKRRHNTRQLNCVISNTACLRSSPKQMPLLLGSSLATCLT
ncbi:hypothetical protein PoB_004442400 [Plakobranchus ocellatus]|uniref:Uncharacterized protein n=1 Tax=Plakobranchus ocellatus TaxID=259542 RepID=A0AAV4BGD3_9GAST|nr:hypothetical protein PoB_004442400 [Plakobranchus ocellatus]